MVVVQLITLSLPTRVEVEVELGCDKILESLANPKEDLKPMQSFKKGGGVKTLEFNLEKAFPYSFFKN